MYIEGFVYVVVIWCNRPLNLSKNVETRNDAALSSVLNVLLTHRTCSPESVVFWSHDKLAWRRGEGGGEKQWTAEEFWEIQNGDFLLRSPFEDLL